MAITTEQVKEAVLELNPGFEAHVSVDDETVISIYPPDGYIFDQPLDVFLAKANAEVWVSAYQEKKFAKTAKAKDIAAFINSYVEAAEAEALS